jgi:hypothetical protein
MKQAAAAEGAKFQLSHPSVEDPTHPMGMPWFADGKAKFYPFPKILAACQAQELLVWGLDDFGQAPPAVQAPYAQWLWGGECGEHVLSPHTRFIAATNRRTDKCGVSGVLEMIKSRFLGGIYHLVSHHPDWDRWARLQGQLHPYVVSYLRFAPHHLNCFEPSQDIVAFACERSWEALSDAVKQSPPADLELAIYAGIVGRGAATGFLAHKRLAQALPTAKEVLADPDKAPIPDEPSALHALCTALAMEYTRDTYQIFETLWVYIKRLYAAKPKSRVEFASVLVIDCWDQYQGLKTLPVWKKEVEKHALGKFIAGTSFEGARPAQT